MVAVKEAYEKMTVSLVGAVNTVVNKSGCDSDLSTNFQSKTDDQGDGNNEFC